MAADLRYFGDCRTVSGNGFISSGYLREVGSVMKYKDLTGLRIGKLTVLEPTEERIRSAVVWRCRCDCGNEILIESRRLKPGVVYSCGCEKAPADDRKDLTGLRFGKLTVEGAAGATAAIRSRQRNGAL